MTFNALSASFATPMTEVPFFESNSISNLLIFFHGNGPQGPSPGVVRAGLGPARRSATPRPPTGAEDLGGGIASTSSDRMPFARTLGEVHRLDPIADAGLFHF